MSEIYIFLGKIQNAYHFQHVIYNAKKFKQEDSVQIYHCMINETMINKNEVVVVYNLDPIKNIANVVIIRHIEANEKLSFDKLNLKIALKRLYVAFGNSDGEILSFKYDYSIGAYLTYEISINRKKICPTLKSTNDYLTINKVTYYATIKKIEY